MFRLRLVGRLQARILEKNWSSRARYAHAHAHAHAHAVCGHLIIISSQSTHHIISSQCTSHHHLVSIRHRKQKMIMWFVDAFDSRANAEVVARPVLLRPVLDPLCNGQVLGEVLDGLAQVPLRQIRGAHASTRCTCKYAVHMRVPTRQLATQNDSRSRDQPEPGTEAALPHFAFIKTSRSAPKSSPCTAAIVSDKEVTHPVNTGEEHWAERGTWKSRLEKGTSASVT